MNYECQYKLKPITVIDDHFVLFWKFKVGNRNDNFPDFYTTDGDVIGWTTNSPAPNIISTSVDTGQYTLHTQTNTHPLTLDSVYNFTQVNTQHSVAVQVNTGK